MKILVIGYGEIAEEFAKLNKDFEFIGIKRSGSSYLSNVEIINCDYSLGLPSQIMNLVFDWILFFPKTDGNDAEAYKNGYLSQLDTIRDNFSSAKRIFISSTRVFSGYSNIIVNEDTPTNPSDQQGIVITEYEQEILSHKGTTVLRLGGLITTKSNFVQLVIQKRLFTNNKYINGIYITDVLNLMVNIMQGQMNQKLVNVIMPVTMKYSDFDPTFEGEPVNAAVKSIHYNDTSQFIYKSIEQIK
jgi:hypothetical protein